MYMETLYYHKDPFQIEVDSRVENESGKLWNIVTYNRGRKTIAMIKTITMITGTTTQSTRTKE